MTMVLGVFIVCLTFLIAIERVKSHERLTASDNEALSSLMKRVAVLESARAAHYDHAAFEELKSKVEGLRIAQGLKRG